MITRRTVLSTVALGASGLVAGAGLLGIVPDDASAANVRLAAPQESIARVLERTGMSNLFGVDASRADAVAALQGG